MASRSRLRPLARAVMRTQSDERLVALARAGHDAAFEEIVRRYRPPLVAFATAYVAADAAEDVVQESLENSWKSLLKTDAEINLKPWLYAIVRNRALNAKRDARVHDSVDEHLAGARTPQEVVLERDQLDRVLTAVAALAPAQRKALVASAFEGRTHDQIAAALETSPASVRGLIHRARGAVRDGVGLLLPLPLVRTISELASDPAAAEAAMSGATLGIAGGAAAGGGLATKAATIVAVATVAAGAGVAVEESLREDDRIASAVSGDTRDRDRGSNDGERADNEPADAFDGASGGDTPSSSGPGPGEDEDEDDDRDDNSGPGSGDDDRRDADDDDRLEVDNSGSGSTNSGSGSLSSGPGDDGAESDDDSSGSGSSGTGSSGSGSFDSDSSGTGDDGGDFELDEPDLDSSGSGSGEELELDDSSGSGS